ncbi:MAG: carbohydrate ABC transporter permease [Candidatus Parvarchaeota archaeon]|nr:carbohydrate ABC transporter permease [Candidatus Jingweiarchaeum tengchongense]
MNNKKKYKKIIWLIALIAVSSVFVLPLLTTFLDALKTTSEYYLNPNPFILSGGAHWDNFIKIFSEMPFFRELGYSTLYASLSTIGVVLSSSLVAYGFSVMRWPGRDKLFFIFLAFSTMIPGITLTLPLYQIFKSFGWLNTYLPLIVPAYFGGGMFNIFIFRQFFRQIPISYVEAARLDGANEFYIFYRIMLPLARPALAVVSIFQFFGAWGDYMGPLIYITDNHLYPLSVGIQMFEAVPNTSGVTPWPYIMVASLYMAIGPIIVFTLKQKELIQGLNFPGSIT